MSAVPAVRPAIEVDAVFTVATARSPSHTGSLKLGSHNGSHVEPWKIEHVLLPATTRRPMSDPGGILRKGHRHSSVDMKPAVLLVTLGGAEGI